MESLQEALNQSAQISEEIGNVFDLLIGYHDGHIIDRPTGKELTELKKRYADLRKQRLEIYQEINRLSKGAIHISKNGNRISIRNNKPLK